MTSPTNDFHLNLFFLWCAQLIIFAQVFLWFQANLIFEVRSVYCSCTNNFMVLSQLHLTCFTADSILLRLLSQEKKIVAGSQDTIDTSVIQVNTCAKCKVQIQEIYVLVTWLNIGSSTVPGRGHPNIFESMYFWTEIGPPPS